MKKQNILLQYVQKQCGTAKVEENSLWNLFKGFISRFLSAIAMSAMPIFPSWRIIFQRWRGVKIGREVFMGIGCWLDSVRPDLITIEDYVSLAGRVTILTHSDPTLPIREILGEKTDVFKPVVLKRGCWITVNVTILPGVVIGENSIIAAGSVVTRSIPDNVVAGGVPARVIRKLKR